MDLKRSVKNFLSKQGIKVSMKQTSQITSSLGEDEVIKKYLDGLPNHIRYVVDIAAADGLWMSNTFSLFNKGYAGLALEYNSKRFAKLADWYQFFPEARLMRCKAKPNNIIELLKTAECPKNFGFLNLDVDSYDHFILDRMLTEYRPSLICAEINERIPAPIKFTVKFDNDHFWKEDNFYGQSVCKLNELAIKYDYDLVEVHYCNAFLIPKELNKSFKALDPTFAYQVGYANKADRKQKFPTNTEVEHLQHIPVEEAMKWLSNHFDQKYKGMYELYL